MNKWSLLLFSVLGLLLSSTSETNFADGRVGGCDRSSGPLLTDTRLSISVSRCTYHSFDEINHLTSPIRYVTKKVELRRPSLTDGRREQFPERQISSDKRLKSLSNVELDLEDSGVSNVRSRKINDVQMRRNLKSCSLNNFRDNNVYRTRSRSNDYLWKKMGRNSREREIDIKMELSEIRDHRFRGNVRPISVLKDLIQDKLTGRTFVKRNNGMPNTREHIDKSLHVTQKNKGKTDIERSNLDISTRRRFVSDYRLSSDLARNSEGRFIKDNRGSDNRLVVRFVKQSIPINKVPQIKYAPMQLAPEIDILKNENRQDYRRLSGWEKRNERIYERKISTDIRRNTDMNDRLSVYRFYDEDISREVLERNCNKNKITRVQNERFTRLDKGSSGSWTIQRRSQGSENRIRNNERLINRYEKRLQEKPYSIRPLPKHISNMNRLQKVRPARFYDDNNLEEVSSIFIKGTEQTSDKRINKIRDKNREIRVIEQFTDDSTSPRTKNGLREKRAISSNNNNRRNDALRHTILERREREDSRYIRQIRNSDDKDNHDARNIQLKLIQSNTVRHIYDDDNFSEELLVRDDPHMKLNRLVHTNKRASQIRVIQRENQNRIHIGAMNIQENRKIQDDPKFNRRLVSNTNRNVEKRQVRTYNEKSNREEFRNSIVRGTRRAIDESRINYVRDNHNYRREYRLNAESVLTRIDRNRKNLVEIDFVSIISNIGNNRFHDFMRRTVTVLKRSEDNEFRYRSIHENQRIFDQRRIRNVLERREVELRNVQRNFAIRNNMKHDMLNRNRRSYDDENRSEVLRFESGRSASGDKTSSYITMSIRHLARQESDTNRIVEDRRAESPNKKFHTRHDFRNILDAETKHSFDESRIDSSDYKFTEKLNAERLSVRNIHKIVENRDSKIRPQFHMNRQNQNTKLTLISLQLLDKNVPTLIRLVERDSKQNRIVRNNRESRIQGHSRNKRIAEMRDLKYTNERSNFGDTRKVTSIYVETDAEVYDSDETNHKRRTERVIRNIARYEMGRTTGRTRITQRISINRRNLQVRSEKQRDVNRDPEYIREVTHFNDLENSHRENRDYNRKSDRTNNRGRDAQDRPRDMRAFNDLQVLKKDSRNIKIRTNEKREIKSAFSKIHLPIEHKTQSDVHVFEIKLQYVFYLFQGLYILSLFTKFTRDSNGIQKRTRFSDWFPLFLTLKVD